MSTLSQLNQLGQERLDIPLLRQLDSSVAADFDVLGGQVITDDSPVILNGFTISVSPSPIGLPANSLYLITANSTVIHPLASEAGSFFTVPSNRPPEILNSLANANVYGTFSPNAANIVGIDYIRIADQNTNNLASFIPANAVPNSTTNQEIQQVVPFARTLNYRIVISNSLFGNAQNICPIAIVYTDTNNNVLKIEDARPLMFRLGSGSDAPNIYNIYSWPQGRVENPITFSSSSLYDPFAGGDKSIQSFKDWCNAVMERLQETAGGQFWYSPVSNWSTMKLIFGNFVSPMTANFAQTPGPSSVLLKWSGLNVACDNADLSGVGGPTQLTFFEIANNTSGATLNNGQCLYVDVDRSMNTGDATPLIAQVGTLDNLGLPTPPFTRFIIAWAFTIGSDVNAFYRDNPYPIGTATNIATTTTYGVVELDTAGGATPQGGSQAIVVNGNGSGLAIANGLSRGSASPPNYGPGTLNIGTLADDTSINIGTGTGTTGLIAVGSIVSNIALTGNTILINGNNSSGTGATTIGSLNTGLGYGLVDLYGTTINLGVQDHTPAINIGTDGTVSGGNISIGNSNATLSLQGTTIEIGNTSGATGIVIGQSTAIVGITGSTVSIGGSTSTTIVGSLLLPGAVQIESGGTFTADAGSTFTVDPLATFGGNVALTAGKISEVDGQTTAGRYGANITILTNLATITTGGNDVFNGTVPALNQGFYQFQVTLFSVGATGNLAPGAVTVQLIGSSDGTLTLQDGGGGACFVYNESSNNTAGLVIPYYNAVNGQTFQLKITLSAGTANAQGVLTVLS